jgi:hypothetical protein
MVQLTQDQYTAALILCGMATAISAGYAVFIASVFVRCAVKFMREKRNAHHHLDRRGFCTSAYRGDRTCFFNLRRET